MQGSLPRERSIRAALAGQAYAADQVRLRDPDLRGFECLVASRQGLFAVGRNGAKCVAYGFFFGLREHDGSLFVFESCGVPATRSYRGRILRLTLDAGIIVHAQVITRGLDNQCHQLAVIDGHICVVDTANQAILRFTPDGAAVDVRRPFPPGEPGETDGSYLHLNSIARVRGQTVLLLHNGTAVPRRQSELAWLDDDWRLVHREPLAGYGCHDIVEDGQGVLWHSGSLDGDILNSDGLAVRVSDRMTRGLALGSMGLIVGTSVFGERHVRTDLSGSVIFLDAELNRLDEIELPAAPTDLVRL
ncbi:hypothetical protein [Sphingomonas koreensis]